MELSARDDDGDALAYTVVWWPAHGTLGGAAPHLTYTPDAGFTGADSFGFTAHDGLAESNVATVGITVDPIPVLEIFEIQGREAASGSAGSVVWARANVVTAVRSDGFFMQTPRERSDGDDETSDGLVVLTGAPPAAAAGDLVDVKGRVREVGGLTVITDGPSVHVLSSDVTPPKPREITRETPLARAASRPDLEHLEGMLVEVEGIASGPTDLMGDTPVVAGTVRSFREPGIEFPGLPELPVWDGNPEIFWLDPDGLPGMGDEMLVSEQGFKATGVLAEVSGSYRLLPSELELEDPPRTVRAVRRPLPAELTIASQNLGGLSSSAEDGEDRLAKAARHIRVALRAPHILAVQEIDSAATLQDLADRIGAGDPALVYTPHMPDGDGASTPTTGYLVREEVFVRDVYRLGDDLHFPFGGELHRTFEPPPLLLDAEYLGGGEPVPIVVVNVQLSSMDGIADEHAITRTRRFEQALRLSELVQDLQVTAPEQRFVVTGDFNAYQFSDGYVDVLGQITGSLDPLGALLPGTDEVEPDLANEIVRLAPGQRYSSVTAGSAETRHFMLTSRGLALSVTGIAYARGNADAPEALLADAATSSRVAAHDGVVLYVLADSDFDGVPNTLDQCADTRIPEAVPVEELGTNRWALADGDGVFDTVPPAGKGQGVQRVFTVRDTAGCSCEQIAAAEGLGEGHFKHGCSTGIMNGWIDRLP